MQLGKIPFQYAVSIVNGNGKTRSMTMIMANNIQHVWFWVGSKYNFNLGLNGGVGEVFSKKYTLSE